MDKVWFIWKVNPFTDEGEMEKIYNEFNAACMEMDTLNKAATLAGEHVYYTISEYEG